MSHGSLRRAAVLIASLDTESADALLDEMSPEQAALVRNAVMQLGDIDIVEQEEVFAQFVENNPQAIRRSDPGVEIAPELARKFDLADPQSTHRPLETEHTQPGVPQFDVSHPDATQPGWRPFAFLADVGSGDLAQVLTAEHPQTTATVLAHLEPAHAAAVIAHLPREQQSEALMRIARLTTPHPEIIRDLEHEIQARLANRPSQDQVGAEGLKTVEAILRSTAAATRQKLVADLLHHDQLLVHQLRMAPPQDTPGADERAFSSPPPPLENDGLANLHGNPSVNRDHYPTGETFSSARVTLDFAELESLESSDLAPILQRCSSNTTLLALAGASHQFVKRLMSQLPSREATQLKRKIENIGPLRLDDVHRAQQQLAAIAQQLIDEGSLIVPGLTTRGKPRLSVAA